MDLERKKQGQFNKAAKKEVHVDKYTYIYIPLFIHIEKKENNWVIRNMEKC